MPTRILDPAALKALAGVENLEHALAWAENMDAETLACHYGHLRDMESRLIALARKAGVAARRQGVL